jgi:predicted transcriptional regulator
MTHTEELSSRAGTRGRHVKFTPERIQQIKNLVERGSSREEIAKLIGATVGSLQVTCSKLGISLRRPSFNNAMGSPRRNDARFTTISAPGSTETVGALLQLTKEASGRNSQPPSGKQPQSAPCEGCGDRANEVGLASFFISMHYRGEERTSRLPLTQDTIGRLAVEAAFRDVSMGELLSEIIVTMLKRDLCKQCSSIKQLDKRHLSAVMETA